MYFLTAANKKNHLMLHVGEVMSRKSTLYLQPQTWYLSLNVWASLLPNTSVVELWVSQAVNTIPLVVLVSSTTSPLDSTVFQKVNRIEPYPSFALKVQNQSQWIKYPMSESIKTRLLASRGFPLIEKITRCEDWYVANALCSRDAQYKHFSSSLPYLAPITTSDP
jgi:hypothetical protein